MNIFFAIHRFAQAQPAINYRRLVELLQQSGAQQADIVILPPEAISGFASAATSNNLNYQNDCDQYWQELARQFPQMYMVSTQQQNSQTHFVLMNQGQVEYIPADHHLINWQQESFFLYTQPHLFIPKNVTPIYFSYEPFYKESPFYQRYTPQQGIMVSALGLQDKGHIFYTHDGLVENNLQKIIQFQEGIFSSIDSSSLADTPLHTPICFALQEFYRRQNINSVVIGLSGGLDSALNLLLHRQIFAPENILAVNMPSPYNSSTTKSIAAHLANQLNIPYITVPIHESITFTKQQLETALHAISPHELTSFMLENVQARDRSSRILAALAAMRQAVFTCNGNKTEFTIGYGTMYGDISGVHAVLGDFWKYEVKKLAADINTYIYEGNALPSTIFTMQPSAELSSSQAVEKGLGDPLVYDYHDYLFRYWVDHPQHPDLAMTLQHYLDGNLAAKIGTSLDIKQLFPTPSEFIADCEHWWKMYKGLAVAKRVQAPPIFAFSPTAFGVYEEAQGELYDSHQYISLKKQLSKIKQP